MVRMNETVRASIEAAAAHDHRTLSALINLILTDWCARNEGVAP
jgi:hypothetical protein